MSLVSISGTVSMPPTKLWLLRPSEALPADSTNPWFPWYDKTFGFVIRATCEAEARLLAHEAGNNENSERADVPDPWRQCAFSTCVELPAIGEPGIIMSDVHSA